MTPSAWSICLARWSCDRMGDGSCRGDFCGERVGVGIFRTGPTTPSIPRRYATGWYRCVPRRDVDGEQPGRVARARRPNPSAAPSVRLRCDASRPPCPGNAAHDVFSTVTTELAHALHVRHTALFRYEPDGSTVLVAVHDESSVQPMSVANTSHFRATTLRRACCARAGSPRSRRRPRMGRGDVIPLLPNHFQLTPRNA